MAKQKFTNTIDWDEYWRDWHEEKDEEYAASVSGGHLERLDRFVEQVGVPDTAAFVGCGPGILAAKVASAYPETQVVGYDAAISVIKENSEEHAELPNISFETAVLPDFKVDQQFDLVFCYATLHYVRETGRAVENLYTHVHSGGHLICNYPNENYREAHRSVAGQLRERLQLPIEGKNLLTQDEITELLDTDVRDFWNFVDADGPFVRQANPCIIVDK